MRLPNFLYIGPDKSGSTWLYHALRAHPAVFLPDIKDLYFFDRYYHRGIGWYLAKFADATDEHIALGELSHDYLYSPQACQRIRDSLPTVRLLTILRNPADRSFSHWLWRRRSGVTTLSFEEDIEACPEVLERSRYAKYLRRYFDAFGRSSIYVGFFSHLQSDPPGLATNIYEFLGLPPLGDSKERLREVRLPAASARFRGLAWAARNAAQGLRKLRMERTVGLLKESRLVQRVLYRPFESGQKPVLSPATRSHLLTHVFRSDVDELENLLGRTIPELRT